MEELGVLYKATDPQGHCYIGQHAGNGSDIGKTYFGSGKYFKKVLKKNGKDYFTYWVFAKGLTQEERNQGEIYYIKFFQARKHQNGYNLNDGGGIQSGFKHTEESKKKTSMSMLGKNTGPKPEGFKKKNSDAQLIAQNRPDVKKKKSENMTIALSKPETRDKMSKSCTIAQNRLDVKKRNSEAHLGVNSYANKTVEELAEIGRKISQAKTGVIFKTLPPCTYCGKEYKLQKYLDKHLVRAHKVILPQIVG